MINLNSLEPVSLFMLKLVAEVIVVLDSLCNRKRAPEFFQSMHSHIWTKTRSFGQAHSESSQTPKMELFAKIFSNWKPLTIFAKNFILYVWYVCFGLLSLYSLVISICITKYATNFFFRIEKLWKTCYCRTT